jgi:membrane-associated phospholipid phosphatase
MDRQMLAQRNLLLLFLAIFLVLISYFFIDKQLAIWISQHHFRTIKVLKYLSEIPELFALGAFIIYLATFVRLSFSGLNLLDKKLLMFANAIAISHFLKDIFKFIFGRYWPETWKQNISLIQHHVYGFHFFHSGHNVGAFPSGHATSLLAGITFLWFVYPRLKWLYLIVTLTASLGLLGMNYHFLGDMIGGGILGYLAAISTLQVSGFFKGAT